MGSTGGFSNGPQNQTGSSAAIGNLTADTEYEVRVRATNAEGDGVWSPSGTGTTGRTITTDPPGVTVSPTADGTEEDPTGQLRPGQPADGGRAVVVPSGTEVTPTASLTFTTSDWDTGDATVRARCGGRYGHADPQAASADATTTATASRSTA